MRAQSVLGLLILSAATAAQAAAPDWARPFLDRPLPQGAFVGDAEWVALRSEIEIEVRPSGTLRRIYRHVLAPTARSTGRLAIGVAYDGAAQRLVPPQLWVRGARRTRQMDLSRSSVEMPGGLAAGTGSERLMLATSEPLAPADRAIVQWEVIDREPLLGEEVVLPFGVFPAAEWVVRALNDPSGGAPHELLLVQPGTGAAPGPRDGEVMLRDVPAYDSVYGQDPWLAEPLEALPYVLLRVGPSVGLDWPGLAAKARAFFVEALAADARSAWAPAAARLSAGAEPGVETAARMASFVQSLPYRDIAWGLSSHRPALPSETLRSLTADCKGKVLLLQALLSEAGIESVPVLSHVGPGYQGAPAVPTLLAFDHVVLAIRLPGAATWPGALADGAGQGWLLFDPTNPLATFGLPPPNLEGSHGLWLGPSGGGPSEGGPSEGGLFPIHTRQPGCHRIETALAVELTATREVRWTLTAAGDSLFNAYLAALNLHQGDAERLRQHFQELLRPALPGVLLGAASFAPPDVRARKPARLAMSGSIPEALQPVGGSLYTLPSPAVLLRQVFGVPALEARPAGSEPKEAREPVPWKAEPRFQGASFCLRGEISLSLPAGWSVVARPALRPIASPWLTAQVEEHPVWSITADLPRGSFAKGSEKQRLADLDALAALFRQPFLLQAP